MKSIQIHDNILIEKSENTRHKSDEIYYMDPENEPLLPHDGLWLSHIV